MKALILAAVVFTPAAVYADEVLKTFEGSNISTTRPFDTIGPWEIQWDASSDLFQIFLYSADGDLVNVAASQQGNGTGSAYQPHAGRFYLQINAIGNWKITIVSVD